MDLAVDVASRVEIANVHVLRFSGERESELPERDVNIEWHCGATTEAISEKDLIRVLAEFRMEVGPTETNDAEKQVAVQITLTLALTYRCPNVSKLSKRALDAFGQINGVYNAWPYWREFVQNTAARMELPRLTVPVFRI